MAQELQPHFINGAFILGAAITAGILTLLAYLLTSVVTGKQQLILQGLSRRHQSEEAARERLFTVRFEVYSKLIGDIYETYTLLSTSFVPNSNPMQFYNNAFGCLPRSIASATAIANPNSVRAIREFHAKLMVTLLEIGEKNSSTHRAMQQSGKRDERAAMLNQFHEALMDTAGEVGRISQPVVNALRAELGMEEIDTQPIAPPQIKGQGRTG